MNVYLFNYNCDVQESVAGTMSIHRTRKGAEMAMEFHKTEKMNEWNSLSESDILADPQYWREFPFDFNQSWDIEEKELLD